MLKKKIFAVYQQVNKYGYDPDNFIDRSLSHVFFGVCLIICLNV